MTHRTVNIVSRTAVLAICAAIPAVASGAQDRIKTMPGYEQYQRMSKEIPGSVKMGALAVTWKDGGKALEYRKDGKTYRYDIAAGRTAEVAANDSDVPLPPGRGRFGRFRQGGP